MEHNDSINFYNKHHPDTGGVKDSDLIVHLANNSFGDENDITNITKKAWNELTNREKINNMTDEEFVEWCGKPICNKINCKHKKADNGCQVYRKCDVRERLLKWLSQKAEPTADDMFAALGYKINKKYKTSTKILYDNAEIRQIIIDKESLHYGKQTKHNIPMLISEDEDRAIHMKIEELKRRQN